MKKIQCDNCGAKNSDDQKCRSCGARLAKVENKLEDNEPWEIKVKRFSQSGLSPGPRKVPLALAVIAFRPSILCFFAFLGSIHIYFMIGFILPFWLGVRRFQLLRSGFLVRPEVVSVETGWGTLETNNTRHGKGWHTESFGYQGPNYKNRLRLWGPNGKSKIIKTSGLKAKLSEEYFLILPNTPRVNMSVCSWFQTSLKPQNGEWKIWPKTKWRLGIELGFGSLFVILSALVFFGFFARLDQTL